MLSPSSLSVCQSVGDEITRCGPVYGQKRLSKVTVVGFSAAGPCLSRQVHHMQERTAHAVLARTGPMYPIELRGGLQALETGEDSQVPLTLCVTATSVS